MSLANVRLRISCGVRYTSNSLSRVSLISTAVMESIPSSANVEYWLIVFRSRIPMILVTHAVKLSDPALPTILSATTMLATIGYGCFMKPSSTSRHELTF
jgi:hypothetical protein